jgi:hypothetical protein
MLPAKRQFKRLSDLSGSVSPMDRTSPAAGDRFTNDGVNPIASFRF